MGTFNLALKCNFSLFHIFQLILGISRWICPFCPAYFHHCMSLSCHTTLWTKFVSEKRLNPKFPSILLPLHVFICSCFIFSLKNGDDFKRDCFNRFGTFAYSNTGHLSYFKSFFGNDLLMNQTSEGSWKQRNTWFWFHLRWELQYEGSVSLYVVNKVCFRLTTCIIFNK